MGCDFYENVYLHVEWKENGEVKMESELLERRPRYFYGDCDSDSEGDYDGEMKKEMDRTEKNYGRKLIYSNNEWKITSKCRIDEYRKYLPFSGKDVKMEKYITCIER